MANIGLIHLDGRLSDRMIEVRRHLHAHPEVSNDEHQTQRYLRRVLEEEGLAGIVPAAGTGLAVDVVGTAGPSNRKVAIRADIDALPIHEETDLPYASTRPGVMHACGHDAHAAMVFAAASLLHRHRDSFSGTVRIIFQPAEEAEPLGGRRIVEEGLLDDVDGAIGIHVDPYLASGKVGVGSGPYTLASDIFDLRISGRSAHAAKPAEGIDAIAVGCALVGEVQKIVSRETDPFDPLIVSVTGFQGGGAYNILADTVLIKGTIRSGSEATRDRAYRRLREIADAISRAHGATAEVKILRGEPPVINDPEMVSLVTSSATDIAGAAAVVNAPGWTAADDFGFYSAKRPSVYFRLGVRNEAKGIIHPLHHPSFQVDEEALHLGAMTLVEAARRFAGMQTAS